MKLYFWPGKEKSRSPSIGGAGEAAGNRQISPEPFRPWWRVNRQGRGRQPGPMGEVMDRLAGQMSPVALLALRLTREGKDQ